MVRYLNPTDYHPAGYRNVDKDFTRKFDFKPRHYITPRQKRFLLYCLQAFSTTETSKSHVNDCFKINGKQMIKMPGKGEYVKFKNYKRNIKSLFMIYADFDVNLVSDDNEKQNPDKI